MKPIFKILIHGATYIFAALLIAWTAYNTWSLLFQVTASPFIASLGLILFEGGALLWLIIFLLSADGLGQMAVSFITAVFDLILVVLAVALHIGAVDPAAYMTEPERAASVLILIATIANLVAMFVFHLAEPAAIKAIAEKAAHGMIMARTYKRLDEMTKDMAEGLAQETAEVWVQDMKEDIRARYQRNMTAGRQPRLPSPNGYHPEIVALHIPEGQPAEATSPNGHRP